MLASWTLDPDRCFSPDQKVISRARSLYEGVADLPLVCPHGHVQPSLLFPDARFGDPAELFIIPDHYVFRMLYSQGVPMEDMGVPSRDGTPVEEDARTIWRRFCENFHLFRGTPTGLWLKAELIGLFGVEEKPSAESADRLFDAIQGKLQQDDFRPRALFESFGIEALATTDAATDQLAEHERLRAQGLPILPTFRPDRVLHLAQEGWRDELARLEELTGRSIEKVPALLEALAERRAYFKERGAKASDHAALTPQVERLGDSEAEVMLQRALAGRPEPDDDLRFHGHMLLRWRGWRARTV
jgi:glucuronate isomerase